VTLASTEAEYVALSEITKNNICETSLETMGIMITLPILVTVDNIGENDLSNNFSLGQPQNILTLDVILLENYGGWYFKDCFCQNR
jgi:hypothetical protein